MENILYLIMGSLLTAGGIGLQWYLSRRDRFNRFRQAAVEKRLDTHQRALSLTFEMQKSPPPDKIESLFNKCHQWWNENSFYLEPQSRKTFRECYWEMLVLQKKSTEPRIIDRKLSFFSVMLPATRKLLSEEIGLAWWDEKDTRPADQPPPAVPSRSGTKK